LKQYCYPGLEIFEKEGRKKALMKQKDTCQRDNFLHTGDRVRVTSYSPFRGLRGTIRTVDTIAADLAEPFCFYAVSLEGAHVREPIWFVHDEVELVDPASDAPARSAPPHFLKDRDRNNETMGGEEQ
jgi:hypothetical protein